MCFGVPYFFFLVHFHKNENKLIIQTVSAIYPDVMRGFMVERG